jgi:DNA-binding NtrC family response regulator
MVYGIVKQAGGLVWVYSEVGKGTCFKIYLPVAGEQEHLPAENVTSGHEVQVRKTTILLVEDDSELRSIVGEFLSLMGHKVIAAESQQEALQIALDEKNGIEILLTDVVLKGGNGKYLAERLRELGCNCKVIFMSGYTPNAIVHHGVLDPGVQFLQKPFSRATLLTKINEVIAK